MLAHWIRSGVDLVTHHIRSGVDSIAHRVGSSWEEYTTPPALRHCAAPAVWAAHGLQLR